MKSRQCWSYSSITQYLRCPLQFYFQRVLGLKPAFTPASLVLGSSVHEALAAYHRGLQENTEVPGEEIPKTFLGSWKTRRCQENVRLDEGHPEEDILSQGVSLIEAYLKEPPPLNIIAVEEEVMAPIFNSEGVALEKPMKAIIDLLLEDNEGLKIVDLKTSGRCYSEFEAAVSLQASCYINAIYENLGQMPTFSYTVLIKLKRPRVQHIGTERTIEDLGRLGDLVESVDRAVQSGIFYRVESALNCSSCPFRGVCKEWKPPTPTARAEVVHLDKQSLPLIPNQEKLAA